MSSVRVQMYVEKSPSTEPRAGILTPVTSWGEKKMAKKAEKWEPVWEE